MNGLIVPSILNAARSQTVIAAALAYAGMGLSILPCKGKKPALQRWAALQHQRAHPQEIINWARAGLLQNVGIISGRVSGNLVVIDLDGLEAVEVFRLRYPELFDTFSVNSGSGKGMHLYLTCNHIMPATTRATGTPFGNIEVRADGCYVVAPPSIHPSGKPYSVAREMAVMEIRDLRDVVAWVASLNRTSPAPATPTNNQPVRKTDYWAAAALLRESDAVRMAGKGERNNTLNRAAFKMGQLVQQGRLTRGEVESALTSAAAALAASDGEKTVARTIKSGLDAGISQPIKWRKQS